MKFLKFIWKYEDIFGYHYINGVKQGGKVSMILTMLLVGSLAQIPNEPVINYTIGIITYGTMFLTLIYLFIRYRKYDTKTTKRKDMYTYIEDEY